MPAHGASLPYKSYAAVAPISKKGDPGSSRFEILSRGNIFPLATCLSLDFSGPPFDIFVEISLQTLRASMFAR